MGDHSIYTSLRKNRDFIINLFVLNFIKIVGMLREK